MNTLTNYIHQLPNDYNMLFIGDGCGFHIPKETLKDGINIYEKCLSPTSWGGAGATRCADSYIVNKTCAQKLCTYNNAINIPIDWWLNFACRDNNFKVYWGEPTIVSQGSANNTFARSY